MTGLVRAYDDAYGDTYLSDANQILDRHTDRLIPDLLIDARGRDIERSGDVNIVVTLDGSTPAKAREQSDVNIDRVCDGLAGAGLTGRKWLKFILWPDELRSGDGLLRFKASGGARSVWLRVDSGIGLATLHAASEGGIALLVNRDDCPLQLGSEALEALGPPDRLAPTLLVGAGREDFPTVRIIGLTLA